MTDSLAVVYSPPKLHAPKKGRYFFGLSRRLPVSDRSQPSRSCTPLREVLSCDAIASLFNYPIQLSVALWAPGGGGLSWNPLRLCAEGRGGRCVAPLRLPDGCGAPGRHGYIRGPLIGPTVVDLVD